MKTGSTGIGQCLISLVHLVVSQPNLHKVLSDIRSKNIPISTILVSLCSHLAPFETQGNLIFEAMLFLRHLLAKNEIKAGEISKLKNVDWSMQKSFIKFQAAFLVTSAGTEESWEGNLAQLISKILDQKIEGLSENQMKLFVVIARKSKVCKAAFAEFCSLENIIVKEYMENITEKCAVTASFSLAIMKNDANVSEKLVKKIFSGRHISPIVKTVGLLKINREKWKPVVEKNLSLIRHKRSGFLIIRPYWIESRIFEEIFA